MRVLPPSIHSLAHSYFNQLIIQVHDHVQVVEIGAVVKDTGFQVKETGTMVKELHAHLLGPAAVSRHAG